MLTQKEKDTLRLMLRGHDAKSMASHLDLSVHTIHERLRAARRKLGVTSSREAARLLAESEPEHANKFAYDPLGDVPASYPAEHPVQAELHLAQDRARRSRSLIWIGAFLAMSILVTVLTITLFATQSDPSVSSTPTFEAHAAADWEKEEAARSWLKLVDASNWQSSYEAAGRAFQQPNTVETWRTASMRIRAPMGAVISRNLVGVQSVNAPPNGFEVIRFKTAFDNQSIAVETVTLEREDGSWKVVGYLID